MALDDNTPSGSPVKGDQSKNEHVAAFLEVLREAMGESSLSDVELLEFARSDMFKEYFPELVSGIPELEAILNQESGKSQSQVSDEPPFVKIEKDVKVETTPKGDVMPEDKNVITLDSSDSSSSVVALSDVPKSSKSVGNKPKEKNSSMDKGTLEKKDKERKVETDIDIKKDRRDSTHSSVKSTGKDEKKEKHSVTSNSTVVAVKKDTEYFEPLTDICRKTKTWKPFYDEDYERYRKKFNLETHVVIICDLQSFKSIFHGPDGVDPSAPLFSATVPLKHNMQLAPEKTKVIQGIEKNKRSSCARELKRRLAIKLKEDKKKREIKKTPRYSSSDSDEEEFKKLINARKRKEAGTKKVERKRKSDSSDDERAAKKRKRNKRVLESSGSDSDVPAISKKNKSTKDDEKEKSKTIQEREKKRGPKKQKKKEEPVKIPSHLKWEKKPDYYIEERDDKEVVKKVKEPRKIISVSQLLAKAQAQRTAKDVVSSVRLNVPKNTTARPTHRTPQTSLTLSDISNQVRKVLNSNNIVEIPVMGDVRHLYDLTVQKIAWWFLKCEEDPPKVEVIHPELHDVVYETGKDGYDSDESVGHVSDPEGLYKPVFDPKAIIDPDIADEYCGFHSLDAQIRVAADDQPNDCRFANCFKIKPGTNYHRGTFQVKCLICNNIIIHGARGLGDHVRSSAHANNFRNRSLDLADYSEYNEEPTTEKVFNAKLKKYGEGEDCQPDLPDYLLKSLNPQPNSTLISSAKVVLDQSSSFFDIKENPQLAVIKDAMLKKGKWTYYLEQKWLEASDEEKKITAKYLDKREKYKKAPEEHPKYADEWNEFWYDRYDEVEASGQDAENHNYEAEWGLVKVGKILRILKEETEIEILEIRKKTHMDYDSLLKLMRSMGVMTETRNHNVPAPAPVAPSLNNSVPLQPQAAPQMYSIPVNIKVEPPSLPVVAPPLPVTAPVKHDVPLLYFTAPPPLPNEPPPLPVVPPPPDVPPPMPKRPPSPPKLSQLESLEQRLAQEKEKLKQMELALEKKKEERRKSKNEDIKSNDKEREQKRSRSRDRSRRSNSRGRRSRSRSRTRKRSRSRDKERRRSKERRKSRSSRSRDRERRGSRSRHRRSRSRSRSRSRNRERGRHVRSVERGRTSSDNKDQSWDIEPASANIQTRMAESPISDTSLGIASIRSPSPYSHHSQKSPKKRKSRVPSPVGSNVSSIAFEVNTTQFASYLTDLNPAAAASFIPSKSKDNTDCGSVSLVSPERMAPDCTPVDMELEEGEISPPPPGTEDYKLPPKVAKPHVPPPSQNKPMKKAPPPPILSGSNSLSSVSSNEPVPPGINKALLPTPTTMSHGSQIPVQSRGTAWTQSYRGGHSNSTSSSNLDHSSGAGHSIPTLTTTSTFRGRILHRGAHSQRGGTGYRGGFNVNKGHNTPHPSLSFPHNPTYPHSQDNSSPYNPFSNPNISQNVVPNQFPIDNSTEQAISNADQIPYTDTNMYPPSTPYTEW